MKKKALPTKHQLKSTATRTALLQAASEVFVRDGFERAQIDEMAKRAGRTRGAVYAQYKTKEQLFFALIEQHMATALSEFEGMTAGISSDPQARLAVFRHYYVKATESQHAILDLELKLYALRHPEAMEDLRDRYDELFDKDRAGQYFGIANTADRSKVDNRIIALEALRSGLILASLFQRNRFTSIEVRLILSETFDGLFPSDKPVANSPAKKSSRR